MTELEAYKEIFSACHWVGLNLNDTFYYSCADSEEIVAYDLEKLVPYVQKYGWKALVAYAAIKRGHDPKVSKVIDEDFKKAKAELQHLADVGEILFEDWWEDDRMRKDLIEFDGQTVKWTYFTNRFVKLLNKDPKQGVYRMCMAQLEDGTLALGRSINDTHNRLVRKFNRKKARLAKETV